MSQCSNCYNGCTEIVSDKCVMYTGVDVPVLEIQKGDSLSYITQALVTFLTVTLNGSGITIDIDENLYCDLISNYLQECSTVTALDLFKALVQASCNLQEQIDTINTTLATLNADYDISCLEGVTSSSDTHDIVQAIITKLCEIDTNLTALTLDISTNYVKISEINSYIQAYIDSQATDLRYSNRMVPYSFIPYYGTLSNFDATGAGLPNTEWENIYLCNGLNGTPDLRGRTVVGAIVGVPGGALDPVVDPGSSAFNPNYALGDVNGANSITLTLSQLAAHSHTITDVGHTHNLAVNTSVSGSDLSSGQYLASQKAVSPDDDNYRLQNALTGTPNVGKVATATTGITIGNSGGGNPHSNLQPVLASYFIIYIP